MILRWAELIVLFVGGPIVMALFIDPSRMWTVLIGSGVLGIVLLNRTAGFEWDSLRRNVINWRGFVLLGILVLAVASVLCWWLLPERLFLIFREYPVFIFVLAIAYPIILVIPQELIYRVLFFKRYGDLFASERTAIFVNAVLFALAHLMYWHWVVFAMTFIGSFIFARNYLRGSFLEAVAYHSIAGLMIFASGLGWLFYSGGNVVQ